MRGPCLDLSQKLDPACVLLSQIYVRFLNPPDAGQSERVCVLYVKYDRGNVARCAIFRWIQPRSVRYSFPWTVLSISTAVLSRDARFRGLKYFLADWASGIFQASMESLLSGQRFSIF